jgi:predicted phage-related endonuclease
MISMKEMVQAHLLNVEREVKTLEDRKVDIDQEIKKLQEYLSEGVTTLNEVVDEVVDEVVAEKSGENTTLCG